MMKGMSVVFSTANAISLAASNEDDHCAYATDWCLCQALLIDKSQHKPEYRKCKGHLFKSGAIQSHDQFKYGRFSTRMRVPGAPNGTVASFFLGKNGPKLSVVPSMVNREGLEIGDSQIHYGGGKVLEGHAGDTSVSEWQQYSIEWTPDSISWFVNGKLVHETSVKER